MLELLSVKDTARLLKVHPMTVYRWTYEHKLPCVRIEGAVRFRPEAIKKFIEEREQVADHHIR